MIGGTFIITQFTKQMYPKTARLHEIADLYGCTVDELLKPRKEEK